MTTTAGTFVKRKSVAAAIVLALIAVACNGKARSADAEPAAQTKSRQVTFTQADLDKFELGLRKEIDAVIAAQAKAASATTAQERGEAIQAQWDTSTIPMGAQAAGLSAARYREIREAVDGVFTTLDFQGKIDGPLSIDLQRADAATKARVSGDAFAPLPPDATAALRAKMDRLVPLWSEYTELVAVAG